MTAEKMSTIDTIIKSICLAAKDVLGNSTQSEITFSPTVQEVPTSNMRPDIGCFVQFSGDFSGIVILNFSGKAALELYQKYMQTLGMAKEDLADSHTNEEVRDFVGEMANQIVGKFRQELENEFGMVVYHNQPKAVSISKSIVISIETGIIRQQCRRASFRTEEHSSFYIELAMEPTEFITLFPVEKTEAVDTDALIASMFDGKND